MFTSFLLPLLASYLDFVSSELVHITPSLSVDSHCPTETCLTLSQFVASSSIYLNSNITTLIFLPGNHNLNSEILIENVGKISILSNFSSPSSVTVTCQQSAWFSFTSVIDVHISSMKFVQCEYTFDSVKRFRLENCTFLNHTGTVIQLFNSTAFITSSYFISNSVGSSHLFIKDGLRVKYVGAVVTMSRSNTVIKTSSFHQNSAEIGGTIFTEIHSNITIINCTFVGNNATEHGGVLYSESGCNVAVYNSIFQSNVAIDRGGVFTVIGSALYIQQSAFSLNEAKQGGVVYADKDSTVGIKGSVTISESGFIDNSASFVGGVLAASSIIITISNCSEFNNNKAELGGGVMSINRGEITVSDSKFNNSAAKFGGVTFLVLSDINISNTLLISNSAETGGALGIRNVNAIFSDCEFVNNTATVTGGAIIAQGSNIKVKTVVFRDNSAHSGGVLFLSERSFINTNNIVVESNSANQGVMYFIECSAIFAHDTNISDNVGSLVLYYSNVTFGDTTSIVNSLSERSTQTFQEGGAITAFQSDLVFEGTSVLMDNSAENGGAIHAITSKIHVYGNSLISNNTAEDSGGGIYLYQSELNCKGTSTLELLGNSAANRGGGIHAISSTITAEYNFLDNRREISHAVYFGSRMNLISNKAVRAGGGVCLEGNAKLKVLKMNKFDNEKPHYTLKFDGNVADYGGALYVADDTTSGTCASTSHKIHSTITECFLQTLEFIKSKSRFPPNLINTKFINNYALTRGSNLFGGLLDRCTQSPFNKAIESQLNITNGLSYLMVFSNNNSSDSISSDPVQVCYCHDNKPDCSYQPPPVQIMKGETFTVSLVAVDQVSHVISATIHSSPKSNESGIGEGQLIQSTTDSCTELSFNVFSPHDNEELIVYADGPCKDAFLSQRRLQIKFLPCSCSVGFQPKVSEVTRCVCECDSRLDGYITNCDPETITIMREGKFWITYISTLSNFSDFLIYPHCPLNYCKDKAELNLNTSNGTDAQCADFRTGTLCGACQSQFSLSLGSSRCITCPNYWPAVLVVILTAASLAGIALVAIILVLNLTVAVGTLNGVIFYANIVNANGGTFFPSSQPTFATVFISWLNLDIGLDTCFIDGLDAYWKTWLQLVFPTYVIFLVIMVIIISERSRRFSRLIGKKNPVATLATLILLSYAKLLDTIIAAFSSAFLNYPGPNGGYQKLVWLPDANVEYLKGKHIALFLAANFILLAGVVYTALLFFWQWLLRFNDSKLLKWTRKPKLSLFIETYHAPYTPQNRYWTGLLLFVRVILYVASAANVSGDPRVNLLIIGSVITGVFVVNKIVGISNRVYKKWLIEILEISCFMNLILLCLATFFSLEKERRRSVVSNVSVSITFILLVGILFYHLFTELMTKLWKIIRAQKCSSLQAPESQLQQAEESLQMSEPTSTVVDGPRKAYNNELREALLDTDQ